MTDGLLAEAGLVHFSGYSSPRRNRGDGARALIDSRRGARGGGLGALPASAGNLLDFGVRPGSSTRSTGVTVVFPNLAEGRLFSGERDPATSAAVWPSGSRWSC